MQPIECVLLAKVVMPGLVPGIHVLRANRKRDVDGRDEPGHDGKNESWLSCKRGLRMLAAFSVIL
jgi:hypothetical protein